MPKNKPNKQQHDHPGGSGAVLGVRVMRNSSVQAVSLIVANVMQLVSVLVVAAFLGPSEMARFALLTFLAGLVTQIASLLVKPGTVRRTFGGGDDDDDDDDDDDVVSSSPPHTLGAGLAWAIALGVIAAALIYVFQRPVADVLLGDPEDENLVALAGLLAGAMLVFKICDITLWLERRPGAFLIADTSRPLLGLVVLDRLPRHRLRGRGGDPRHPDRHRRRRDRRPRPAARQLRAQLRPRARSSRSSSAAATGRRS